MGRREQKEKMKRFVGHGGERGRGKGSAGEGGGGRVEQNEVREGKTGGEIMGVVVEEGDRRYSKGWRRETFREMIRGYDGGGRQEEE